MTSSRRRGLGWRAVAIPVLTVLTVLALARTLSHPAAAATASTSPAVVSVTSTDATTVTVTTTPPAVAPAALPDRVCATNTQSSRVVVSISAQHVWMCSGATQLYDSPATTGETDNGDATPTGTWAVQSRETNRYLTGPGYRDYVHYWIPFHGDFGFHDATWQTFPFGSPLYRTQGSHGCVHLPMTAMAWLYHWAHTQTTVVTVQA